VNKDNKGNKRGLRKKKMRKEMKIKEIQLKALLHNYLHCSSKKITLTMDNYLDASEYKLKDDQKFDLDRENGD
jgi:hypothetical protein